MARQKGGFRRSRGPRRRTGWEAGTGGTTVTEFSTLTPAFIGNAVVALLDGLTLLRTRGFLKIVQIAGATANDGMVGAFGIGIATTAAITAGIGSVPTPITEQEWEGWLYWQGFSVSTITATEGDGVNAVARVQEFIIDSKAMRKIDENESLYAAFEVGTEVGAVTIAVTHDCRMLFALP